MATNPYPIPGKWDNPHSKSSQSLGEIHNYLGILSPDNKHFYAKDILEVISATDLSKMLGISRTLLYNKQIPLKDVRLRKRIIQLVIASDLAYVLLGNDTSKTFHWMFTPNLVLFGDTPFEVIMRDEGEAVISWLMERRGLKPGAAF